MSDVNERIKRAVRFREAVLFFRKQRKSHADMAAITGLRSAFIRAVDEGSVVPDEQATDKIVSAAEKYGAPW